MKKNRATVTSGGVYCLDKKDFHKDFCTLLLIGPRRGPFDPVRSCIEVQSSQMCCAAPSY